MNEYHYIRNNFAWSSDWTYIIYYGPAWRSVKFLFPCLHLYTKRKNIMKVCLFFSRLSTVSDSNVWHVVKGRLLIGGVALQPEHGGQKKSSLGKKVFSCFILLLCGTCLCRSWIFILVLLAETYFWCNCIHLS